MSANKVVRDPLWTTLLGALVASMVVSFFVVVQSGEAKQAADKKIYEPQIIGGTEVPNGKYPFMAYIEFHRNDGRIMSCGGSLIDQDSVLTAAHCFVRAQRAVVAFGRTDLRQRNQGQVRAASRYAIHPRFNGRSFAYDVGVLKLKHAVTGIKPIKLATAGEDHLEKPGRILTVAGWGATSEGDRSNANRLRQVQVPVVSDSRAKQAYSSQSRGLKYFPSLMVAAGVKGKDHCYGDSGGPLFKPGTPSTQVGIASYAKGCARAGYPGVSTEVNNPNIKNFILAAARR
jgi:secreted trypsin-like serine protease